MTTAIINGMVWTETHTSKGTLFTNTTDNITGVLYWENNTTFYRVVMVDGETEYRESFDNHPHASWNVSNIHSSLIHLAEVMYEVENELMEEAEDDFYAIGADYDAHDAYDTEYDRY